MAGIIESVQEFFNEHEDPRTKDWFLCNTITPIATILVTYLYFCKYAGPQYMKDRKPYDLKYVLIVYNLFQVLFSIYLVYEGGMAGWFTTYKWTCEPIDKADSPLALRIATAVWLYYMAKITELLDTVFFILRKKYNQVTFLHLYHHTMMPLASYVGTKYLPGGHATFLGEINSFIHVIMYTYYLLAAFGPHMQKYLWWKKYLTMLQLIQFCIVFEQNMQAYLQPNCDYPKPIIMMTIIEASIFIYLFGKFYVQSYIKGSQSPKQNKNIANGKPKQN